MSSITHSGVTHTKRITALAPTHKGRLSAPMRQPVRLGQRRVFDPRPAARSFDGDREGNSLRTMDALPSRRSKKLSNGCA
jgi:hypothetical protein